MRYILDAVGNEQPFARTFLRGALDRAVHHVSDLVVIAGAVDMHLCAEKLEVMRKALAGFAELASTHEVARQLDARMRAVMNNERMLHSLLPEGLM